MKSLQCNDYNFKSDPLFSEEPMKLNKQRGDMFTSTAKMKRALQHYYGHSADVVKYILAYHRAGMHVS